MTSPLSLASSRNVPLIGLPAKVLQFTIVVSVDCQCAPGEAFQVIVTAGGSLKSPCPRCQRIYSVNAMAVSPHGQLGFGFAIETPIAES